jgi:1-acyl-sn-glycerol-3-phosphate acyltransferase
MPSQCLFPVCNAGFKTTLRLFAKFDVQGRENIPAKGPLIVVSSHLSNLDPAIVAAILPVKPGFLAKKELFRNPVMRFLLTGYGAFPVDRGKADLAALNWGAARLRSGGALVVFPEGTRSRGQGLLKAQQGPALLARMTGAPVVPVALTGSEKLQNLLKVLMPRADLKLVVGRPFRVKIGDVKAGREQLERTTLEMMVRIARMLPESRRGHYGGDMAIAFEATEDVGT